MEAEACALAELSRPGQQHPNIVGALGQVSHLLPLDLLPYSEGETADWTQSSRHRPTVTHLGLELCEGGSLASYIE